MTKWLWGKGEGQNVHWERGRDRMSMGRGKVQWDKMGLANGGWDIILGDMEMVGWAKFIPFKNCD